MITSGNTDYKKIEDKQYLSIDTDNAQKIVSELNKNNIKYSARYDETKLSVTFSKSDFDKVNEIIYLSKSDDKEKAVQSVADKALEDIKQQLEEIRERQKIAEEQQRQRTEAEKEAKEQEVKHPEQSVQTSEKAEKETAIVPRESMKLLPIINSAVITQYHRLDSIAEKRAVREDKISLHQTKISKLTAKAERLTTTNQMLQAFKKAPGVSAVISRNEQRIFKIHSEKIPKRQAKIDKHIVKIAVLDRKSDLISCKISRFENLNKLIKSFTLLNNSERKLQFSQAMDGLHKNSIDILGHNIDKCTVQIAKLTSDYKTAETLAAKQAIQTKLVTVKARRQTYIDKRNKLNGVIIPYVEQPDNVINEVIKKTESTVDNAVKNDKAVISKVTEDIVTESIPLLPEQSLSVPPKTIDKSLIPEIADVMEMSVSEIESKPIDIQNMLILDYTNNYFSDPATLQESLSTILNPNYETEKNLQNKKDLTKEKENPLKSVEELVEGNANMIDGIINNLPPEKETTEKKVFNVSRNQLNENARKIHEQPAEHKHRDKEPPNHNSL